MNKKHGEEEQSVKIILSKIIGISIVKIIWILSSL